MYTQIRVSLGTVSHSEDWARRWWWERPLSLLSSKTIVIRDLTDLVTLALMMASQPSLQLRLAALRQYTAMMPTKQGTHYLVQTPRLWTWKTAGFWFAFNIADASQLWIRVAPQNYCFLFPHWLKCNVWAHTYFPKTWLLPFLYVCKILLKWICSPKSAIIQ